MLAQRNKDELKSAIKKYPMKKFPKILLKDVSNFVDIKSDKIH